MFLLQKLEIGDRITKTKKDESSDVLWLNAATFVLQGAVVVDGIELKP